MKFTVFLGWIGVVFALVLLRYVLTGSIYYLFILWNMLLAGAPLWVESLMYSINRTWKDGSTRNIVSLVLGATWLLLLPNAFYILTDFMHQNSDVVVNMRHDGYYGGIHYARGDAIFVFDSFLIFVATVFGSYCGGLALLHAYIFFKKQTGKVSAYFLLGCVMVLSGIGVYIGRYGRWNSWDIIYRPWHIAGEFFLQLASSTSRERIMVTVLTIVLLQFFAFYAVRWSRQKRAIL